MTRVTRRLDAPPETAWSVVSDLDRWDQMLPTMRSVTRLDDQGPAGVGARFEVRQPGLTRAVYEITEWDPGAGFTWTSSSPGVRTTASHTLRPRDGGTELTLGIDWSGPLAGLVRLLLGARVRRMVEQEADTFARLVEQ